jgi:MoxR-like ATPase
MHDNNDNCWTLFDEVIAAGVDRVILYGPPGTGKTFTALHCNKTHTQESYRITCTDDMTNMDVTGGFLPSADGGFEWIEGAAVKAMTGGGRLVVDEIDKAGGDVFATLLNITDSDGSSIWEHPVTGQKHTASHGYTVIMTTNVEQIEELPQALIDRFPVRIRIDRPHPLALETLPLAWRDYADRMADAGAERMSLRLFQSLNKLSQRLGTEKAAKVILGDRADAFLQAVAIDTMRPIDSTPTI